MIIEENGKLLTIVKVDWKWDYLLHHAIRHEIDRRWEETMYMAEKGYGKYYWADEIDHLADILLDMNSNSNQGI